MLGISCLQNFFGKQVRVDDSDHAALFIHDGESEKFIKHEELACLEYGCFRGNSHDAPHHYFMQRGFQWRSQQTPGRDDAYKSLLFIDRVKVNYTLANALASDPLQRVANRHVSIQQRKILPRVVNDR